jgi:hypothetical protein
MPFPEFIIVIQIERFAIVIVIMLFLASYFLFPVFLIELSHLHRYIRKLLEERHFSWLFDDINVATIRWKDLQVGRRVLHILQVPVI